MDNFSFGTDTIVVTKAGQSLAQIVILEIHKEILIKTAKFVKKAFFDHQARSSDDI